MGVNEYKRIYSKFWANKSEFKKEKVRVRGMVCAQAHQNHSVFSRDWKPFTQHLIWLWLVRR
jgi:hypothetical protein